MSTKATVSRKTTGTIKRGGTITETTVVRFRKTRARKPLEAPTHLTATVPSLIKLTEYLAAEAKRRVVELKEQPLPDHMPGLAVHLDRLEAHTSIAVSLKAAAQHARDAFESWNAPLI